MSTIKLKSVGQFARGHRLDSSTDLVQHGQIRSGAISVLPKISDGSYWVRSRGHTVQCNIYKTLCSAHCAPYSENEGVFHNHKNTLMTL